LIDQTSAVFDEPPLLTLLSWVWIALTIEIDNASERRPSQPTVVRT
jgi:hypothetical protein